MGVCIDPPDNHTVPSDSDGSDLKHCPFKFVLLTRELCRQDSKEPRNAEQL